MRTRPLPYRPRFLATDAILAIFVAGVVIFAAMHFGWPV